MVVHFGIYESIGKGAAVCGEGLIFLLALLARLVEIQPCLEINHSQLKTSFLHLIKTHASVVGGNIQQKAKTWAALRAERMTTIMSHVRRVVRSDKRLEQMMGKMPAKDFDDLQNDVLKKMILREVYNVSSTASRPPRDNEGESVGRAQPDIRQKADVSAADLAKEMGYGSGSGKRAFVEDGIR